MTTLREAAKQALEALMWHDEGMRTRADSEAIHALRVTLAEPAEWTDADADAARLALELEALLLDTKDMTAVSRWWASGHDALNLHRQRLRGELDGPDEEPVQVIGGAA